MNDVDQIIYLLYLLELMKISVFLLFYGSIEIEGCVKPVEIINFRKSLMCSRST